MARLSRLAIDQQLHHLVHRAQPGVDLLRTEADCSDFLVALLDVSRELGVDVHAYAILPDRVQLLLTPVAGSAISSLMQRVGRRFVGAYNQRHGLTGSPWLGRYRTSVVHPGDYLLAAMHHVELAPLNAGLVGSPAEWKASSAAHHLGLRLDPLITDHPAYFELGNTPFEREASYRRSLERQQTIAKQNAIGEATEKGWALGNEAFLSELLKLQARRLRPRPRGRPAAAAGDPCHSDPKFKW